MRGGAGELQALATLRRPGLNLLLHPESQVPRSPSLTHSSVQGV